MRYKNTDEKQPDVLADILALRPEGPFISQDPDDLRNRIKGALVGRCAGCLLGVPVEFWSFTDLVDWSVRTNTQPYPPTDYWNRVSRPDDLQYRKTPRKNYQKDSMEYVGVDDDITYTILNMLCLEKYGKNYTVDDMGKLWLDILPYACTAEDEALTQLQCGTQPMHAAEFNEYVEWIGAAIRADAFGYACAGHPEEAAKISYPDAYLSHRKNGIYGEMFCAAAIAAAFVVKDPLDAVREGMKQIPKESELYQELCWALDVCASGDLTSYAKARGHLDNHFKRMNKVHTIINMCAIVFGLALGEGDYTKAIGNTVAIGYDNDCTGATVGSIMGAMLGFDKIPEQWYKNFNDRIDTYIIGEGTQSIEDCVDRFVALNKQ